MKAPAISAAPSSAEPQYTPAEHIDSIDPASGDVIARFAVTPPRDVAQVIARSRSAQHAWARRSIRERAGFIARLHDVLFARRQELAEIVAREVGKPRVEALFADVLLAIDTAAYYAKSAERLLRPEKLAHHSLPMKSKSGRLHLEPLGVLGMISPWNYPLAIPFGTLIPAVAAGNAVVLKPSEWTPWCGALVQETFQQTGFPDGLVSVIQGGGEVGAALVNPVRADGSPAPEQVDKIFFTGSVATGKKVAEACARRLIPSVLELGGKDAMLVLADADLEIASSAAVWGSFTNCGQACLSVERIFVAHSVADKFTALCVAKTKKLKLGSPLDADVEVGPMIRPSQAARVEEHLADAARRGARILTGGQRRSDFGETYLEPAVVANTTPDMQIMREETFGPVLAICPVRDADEAVRLANDSPFALGASVWTRDPRIGKAIAARLNAGAVMVNDLISAYGICEAPHGGRGSSGWGRTHSRLGLMEMVHVKYVAVDRLPRTPKAWWFGYGTRLADAADAFVAAMHAPDWRERLRAARGAMDVVFRKDRI